MSLATFEIFRTRCWHMEPVSFQNYRKAVLGNATGGIKLGIVGIQKPDRIQEFLRLPSDAIQRNDLSLKTISLLHAVAENMIQSSAEHTTQSEEEGAPTKKSAGTRSAHAGKNASDKESSSAENPTSNGAYVGDAVRLNSWGDLEEGDIVVNVVYIDGPIIRNGDACSYGSIDMRNRIMRAADLEQVIGHVIILNTPGGSSDALRDYIAAFNYARERGQEVIALVDGVCASMGTGIATQCDKIYFVNPEDEIGSIGTYGATYTQKDGDQNTITQETYHEVYATASKDKNKWYRAAAQGDITELANEVEKAQEDFISKIKSARPKVKNEQLTGAMYKCGEVVGSLTDGQSTLRDISLGMIDKYMKSPAYKQRTMSAAANQNSTSAPALNNNNKSQNMETTKYPLVSTACGSGKDLQDNNGDIFLNAAQASSLEAHLTEAGKLKQQLAEAQASLQEANKTVVSMSNMLSKSHSENEALAAQLAATENKADDTQGAPAEALEAMKQEHEAAISALNEAHATALSEKEEALRQANEKLAQLEKDNSDLKSEVDELSQDPGTKGAQAGPVPVNNGDAPKGEEETQEYKINPKLSIAENNRLRLEHEAKLREKVHQSKLAARK